MTRNASPARYSGGESRVYTVGGDYNRDSRLYANDDFREYTNGGSSPRIIYAKANSDVFSYEKQHSPRVITTSDRDYTTRVVQASDHNSYGGGHVTVIGSNGMTFQDPTLSLQFKDLCLLLVIMNVRVRVLVKGLHDNKTHHLLFLNAEHVHNKIYLSYFKTNVNLVMVYEMHG